MKNPHRDNLNAFDANVSDVEIVNVKPNVKNSSKINPDEIRIVPAVISTSSYDKNSSNNEISSITRAAQIVFHSLSRQLHTNFKLLIDNSLKDSGISGVVSEFNKSLDKKGLPKTLLTGIGSRVTYVTCSMFPAVWIKDQISKKNPDLSAIEKAGISAGIETMIGVPFEFLSNKHAFMKDGKLPIGTAVKGVGAAAIPFLFRNMCGWTAAFFVHVDGDSIKNKVMLGAISGLISTPFDTLGNMMMRNAALSQESIIKAVSDSFINTINECFIKNPENFLKKIAMGAPFRVVPGILQALIFSQLGADEIGKATKGISDFTEKNTNDLKEFIGKFVKDLQKNGKVEFDDDLNIKPKDEEQPTSNIIPDAENSNPLQNKENEKEI